METNPNVRRSDETLQQYRERLRSQTTSIYIAKSMTSHRTVAQAKRAALKRRNMLRSKR